MTKYLNQRSAIMRSLQASKFEYTPININRYDRVLFRHLNEENTPNFIQYLSLNFELGISLKTFRAELSYFTQSFVFRCNL